ncbi:MAG: tRNA (N(6)-L-threonylcarbamoyladenosine(37)-C(2))-methylthiotransferase MtaB [Desulfobulbales bacterium]
MLSLLIFRKLCADMKLAKTNPKKVAVVSLGCKVNQYETASFQSCFAAQGFIVSPFDEPADIYVINTCAVTAKAAAQSRQLIRRTQRTNPQAKIVVTGCYAQIAPQTIREITPLPITIVGNGNKHQVIDAVLSTENQPLQQKPAEKYFTDIGVHKELRHLPVNRFPDRTRAFLKVQDGCNNFCSYCIVPYARGRSRSLAPDTALRQALLFAEEGHKEIVLTGIHLGHYGQDLPEDNTLLDMMQKLAAATPTIRYRLSSLEPTEINRELLELMGNTANVMPHLHIPLQSGSDSILKKMRRNYTAGEFRDKVHCCKNLLPTAAIGVDVLVGFPGETEEDFHQTLELIKELPVSYLHVFPFSKRPGTPAARMAGQIKKEIKEERVAALRKLDHKKRTAFYESMIGTVHHVLVETKKTDTGLAKGFTDNYIPVHFQAEPTVSNQVVPVRLEKLQDRFVRGRLA